MCAMRAAGTGAVQIEDGLIGFSRQAEQFSGLGFPVALHHYWQAIDDHVEEASDDQAEDAAGDDEGQGGAGQRSRRGMSDDVSEFENGEVHRNDKAADDDTQHSHDHGFHQAG